VADYNVELFPLITIDPEHTVLVARGFGTPIEGRVLFSSVVPSLATVATSGAYADLTGKPTLFDGSWGALTGKPSTFTPSAHTHVIDDVTGLQAALDGKQAAGSYATAAQGALAASALQPGATIPWSGVSGKPSTFTPSSHTHLLADVTGLVAALAGKQDAGSYQPLAAVLTDTTAAFTTGQQSKLAGISTGATVNATDAALRDRTSHTGTQPVATITGLAAIATSGSAADLSGSLLIARFNSGTAASAGTYWRGDGQWKAPVHVGTSAPSSPAEGDLWVDTN